ncbi:hypothetical protein CO038_04700 [Candidatus Pacearchaeota archaeon CG_4_9_14_0_2_um_filter_39_13]|nr:hypothetical protein [Candidatus Pacearchaeota archaeon]OIO42518.1 MAG: hypothetical protein AUJ64_03945 [Candidatus Pacearchaeota archaeon CG1_02_39_14]PJC44256.1 MAG: hypothetical protein CO038_04700 [Candidatus Pacearchaeota archaeon CG_4_9_14_0_2_um_filter_39_13]
MKRKTGDLKKGDMIIVGGQALKIEEIETSDIGKQGTKKCRIVASKEGGEKVTIIRPSDYPFEVK